MTASPRELLVVAGEASGDLHGAALDERHQHVAFQYVQAQVHPQGQEQLGRADRQKPVTEGVDFLAIDVSDRAVGPDAQVAGHELHADHGSGLERRTVPHPRIYTPPGGNALPGLEPESAQLRCEFFNGGAREAHSAGHRLGVRPAAAGELEMSDRLQSPATVDGRLWERLGTILRECKPYLAALLAVLAQGSPS